MNRYGLPAALLFLCICSLGCVQRERAAGFWITSVLEDIRITGEKYGGREVFGEEGRGTRNALYKKLDISDNEVSEKMAAGPGEVKGQNETGPFYALEEDQLVPVKKYIPDILLDLRYATENNFTKQRIYGFTEAYLRYGTIGKLKKAQEMAKQQGMLLKIWDAYRPVSAQFKLWEICPDPVYVANPNRGFSSHSRGNTVDITLVYADGSQVEMPTEFDDFSLMADRDYSDCTEKAAQNAQLLENIMKECGFEPYAGEWWHFSDADSYPVEEEFEP